MNHDNNRSKSYPMTPETNYAGWIITGLVALILVLGVIAIMSRADRAGAEANAFVPAISAGQLSIGSESLSTCRLFSLTRSAR